MPHTTEGYSARKRNRLLNYDYSQAGCYFVTICVDNMAELFGTVENDEMLLNEYGKIAEHYWQKIPDFYKNISLDEYTVMPNHLHGIIVINDSEFRIRRDRTLFCPYNMECAGTECDGTENVGTEHAGTKHDITENVTMEPVGTEIVGTEQCSVPTKTTDGKRYGLLSKIIKSYKEACVKHIRKNFSDYNFAWQRSFYDHIIRNEKSLINIRKYIRDNPLKWALERNNRENLFC